MTLRPMTEGDWDVLSRWDNDPELLHFTECDDVDAYALEETQGVYRRASWLGFTFIVEHEGSPIGYCWIQRLRVTRILDRFPGLDCRGIVLAIGEKHLWGQGLGTETIRLLTEFGFEREDADVIACSVIDYNIRSRRAFEKAGYTLLQESPLPEGTRSGYEYDLILTRGK